MYNSKDFKGATGANLAQLSRCVGQLTPISGLKGMKHLDPVSFVPYFILLGRE
jgi:hypothetical protein